MRKVTQCFVPITDSPVTNRLLLGIQNLWILIVIIVQTANLSILIYLGALRKFCCHSKPESSSSLTVTEKSNAPNLISILS